LRALRARTADVFEVESAGSDELAQSTCRSSSEFCFGGAAGVAGLGRVKANESDVGVLVVDLDCVSVQNPDVGRIDWLGIGGHGKEQPRDTGYEETGHRGLGFIFSSIRSAHFTLASKGNFAHRRTDIAFA